MIQRYHRWRCRQLRAEGHAHFYTGCCCSFSCCVACCCWTTKREPDFSNWSATCHAVIVICHAVIVKRGSTKPVRYSPSRALTRANPTTRACLGHHPPATTAPVAVAVGASQRQTVAVGPSRPTGPLGPIFRRVVHSSSLAATCSPGLCPSRAPRHRSRPALAPAGLQGVSGPGDTSAVRWGGPAGKNRPN